MTDALTHPPALQRASGEIRMSFRRRGERSVLGELYQRGCGKVRFPRAAADAPPEAVIINTAGGLTDGDQLRSTVHWQAGASAIVTTQAAERIYRSREAQAQIHNRLIVDADACAVWLPQETIVFNGGRMQRHTDIVLAGGASLLAAESMVFGRTAMGERVVTGSVCDRWRISIDGQLVFADAIALDDQAFGSLQAALDRPAIAAGAHALATLLLVTSDAARYVEALRDALSRGGVTGGVSQPGACLVVRAMADDAAALRRTMIHVFNAIQSLKASDNAFRHFTVPRVFHC